MYILARKNMNVVTMLVICVVVAHVLINTKSHLTCLFKAFTSCLWFIYYVFIA